MKEVLSSIFFLGVVIALLWGGNHWRQRVQIAQDTRPSIGVLATESQNDIVSSVSKPSSDTPQTQTIEEKKPAISAPTDAVKTALNVKVINGGAVKGSAVKVQGILKQNGYVKVQVGNSLADYTGVVVYYSGSNEAIANAIQQLLTKDYPKTSVNVSTSPKAENGSASVVVILGK